MTANHCWETPPVFPFLAQHQAHVWCAQLDCTEENLVPFSQLLSVDEQARAQRFHFAKDRTHYTVARALLRLLLQCYLHVPAAEIQFHYNNQGKPTLADYPLQFNISHSHGMALYAVTHETTIGVDIEFMNRPCEIDGIIERFFSAAECQCIKKFTGLSKTRAFFQGWTCKEAFLKAHGAGLALSLAQTEVVVDPDYPAAFITLPDPQLNKEEWYLQTLTPFTGYAAALAVHGNIQSVLTFNLPHTASFFSPLGTQR